MRDMPSILSLFRNEYNKFNKYRSTNVSFNLSYCPIKITFKLRLSRKTLRFTIYPRSYNGRHYIALHVPQYVNQHWFIDLYARRYITPWCDVL